MNTSSLRTPNYTLRRVIAAAVLMLMTYFVALPLFTLLMKSLGALIVLFHDGLHACGIL
jgi:hypothetical protein